ncbi:Na(+)-translocating NADH-quinone reductase subunit A [Chlamydiales bacterium SCGC AG-110-P3]|nr:Na(+)-translocating NADH-quinone reductase subunit A [Chlamydiales bacterium SCGC AG-110-P3]
MAHIKVNAGLDVPIEGSPSEGGGEDLEKLASPREVSLNLHPFEWVKFKLLVKAGDKVKLGQPLVYDKMHEKRKFVSPAGGVVKEVRRGLKRRLLDIVIEVDEKGGATEHNVMDASKASRQEIIDRLLEGGGFAHIRHRPFNLLANYEQTPRSIFVKAIESAPFAPTAELQVSGHEAEFQAGLTALSRLTEGDVHLVHHVDSNCDAFTKASDVQIHTVEGPHPAGNLSVHISNIDPINQVDDVIWTVDVVDAITIGSLLLRGVYYTDRVLAIGGSGITESKRAFVRGRMGHPIGALIAGRNDKGLLRMISGDVLMGQKVEVDDFIHFNHTVFSVIPESIERELLHFFRLGVNKYTHSRTYLSGLLKPGSRSYRFTTSLHGEHRGMVDGAVYQEVMPLQIPVLALVRAVQGRDWELADSLGLLEVDGEDFALPTFVCPSKTEMVDIIKGALHHQAAENIH